MRPLSATHFRSASGGPMTAHPLVAKLAARMSEAVRAGLAGFGTAAPRVTLDAISEVTAAAEGATALRFENRTGSLPAWIALDRALVFAMCELALGGTGTEEPLAESGRPFSGIETELRKSAVSAIAAAACSALSQVLAVPFGLFEESEADSPPGPAPANGYVSLRYLVNIFGYSGELRMSFSGKDLALHAGTPGKPPEHDNASGGMRELQRQIAGAMAEFRILLEPELVQVRDIVALRPGGLLKLAATMSSPVIVSSGGVDVYTATLAHSGGGLAARLIGPSG